MVEVDGSNPPAPTIFRTQPHSLFFRIAERTHVLFLPSIYVLLAGSTFSLLTLATDGSYIRETITNAQLVGTLTLYTLLPAYLMGMAAHQRRRTLETMQALRTMARWSDVQRVRRRLEELPALAWLAGLTGAGFGAAQNPELLASMYRSGAVHALDVGFLLGACLVWAMIAAVLCWRLPTSAALYTLGSHMHVDLYRLDRVRPLGRLATTDILVVAGAMAFMPLQSLDAEFRLGNYQPGVVVGVPAALAFFLLPLWGLHREIRSHRARRVQALQASLEQVPSDDVIMLEALAAHIERIRSIPAWPLDLKLLTRLLAYVVIPPLAWVGAALVEGWVDRL